MDDDNNWFHGDISTRTEAEKVLTDHCCRTRDIRRDVVKKNKSLEKIF